jgi:bacterioferritin
MPGATFWSRRSKKKEFAVSNAPVTRNAPDRDAPDRNAPDRDAPARDSFGKPFLTDVKTLRERARTHLSSGVVSTTYGGDVKKTIDILQTVLATEIVCVLRYTMHAVTATGISSEAVKAEFAQHAKEEQAHMMAVAERIDQLGGTPNFNPEGLATRSASQYAEGENLVDMIKENLIAERLAVDHYRELIRYFGDDDPSTRVMLEGILSVEEEHATDMHDLLVAHEGEPLLEH